jgi:hypothetical protein
MTSATATIENIIEELKVVKTDINYIKTYITSLRSEICSCDSQMVDVDSIMTREDYIALEEYEKEKSEKSLVSHEQLKKELGL